MGPLINADSPQFVKKKKKKVEVDLSELGLLEECILSTNMDYTVTLWMEVGRVFNSCEDLCTGETPCDCVEKADVTDN